MLDFRSASNALVASSSISSEPGYDIMVLLAGTSVLNIRLCGMATSSAGMAGSGNRNLVVTLDFNAVVSGEGSVVEG